MAKEAPLKEGPSDVAKDVIGDIADAKPTVRRVQTHSSSTISRKSLNSFSGSGDSVSPTSPSANEATAQSVRLKAMMLHEGELRELHTLRELKYFLVNEVRKVLPSRQAWLLEKSRGNNWKISTVSNLVSTDQNAPMVLALEKVFNQCLAHSANKGPAVQDEPIAINVDDAELSGSVRSEMTIYPFRFGWLLPLPDINGKPIAFLAVMRELPFEEVKTPVAKRLSRAYGHAWLALTAKRVLRPSRAFWQWRKAIFFGFLITAFFAMFIPVPMTALAPVEVVAKDAFIVTAPMEGVVDRVLVEPNEFASVGTPLVSYIDTEFASRFEVAERNVLIARARYQRARQGAFGSGEGRRELAITKSELDLAVSEMDYAKTVLDRSVIKARKSGQIVFNNRNEWRGRPVSTGERIFEIADPKTIEYRIELAVSDAIVLNDGARVKLFLDSDPLKPFEALLTSAGYHAERTQNETLAFTMIAAPQANEKADAPPLPRIGSRGTAQIYGEKAALWFYLFRRPIAATRQWLGL